MGNTILNIAGGKIPPLNLETYEPYFLVNIDTMYYANKNAEFVESEYKHWRRLGSQTHNIKEDIVEFMERTVLSFDRICIYRYLEHVAMVDVPYFIYLLSTVARPGSIIEVIVPNYEILARMILDEFPLDGNFDWKNILLTTELLNEPSCPHASIWTKARAEYLFTLEKRFEVIEIDENFKFDGRDIYLKFLAKRI
jgi:hypothetical protein